MYHDDKLPIVNNGSRDVISMKSWLVTLLLLCVPGLNIVLLFVWAFGKGNENRRNYAKAGLILMGIGLVLYILFAVIIMGLFIGTY